MLEHNYKILKNFGWNEKTLVGDLIRDEVEDLNDAFMDRLDWAVSYAKKHWGKIEGQFFVYYFTLGTHSKYSYHYRGRAGDGFFRGINLFETFLIMQKAGFKGIGIYPNWKPYRGVHVDDRSYDTEVYWIRDNGKYIYTLKDVGEQLVLEAGIPPQYGIVA